MLTGTSSHGGGGGTSPDVAALPPFDTSDRSETRGGGRGAAEERGERVEDRRTVEEVEERVEEIGCTRREKKFVRRKNNDKQVSFPRANKSQLTSSVSSASLTDAEAEGGSSAVVAVAMRDTVAIWNEMENKSFVVDKRRFLRR